MKNLILIFAVTLLAFSAESRNWKRIKIPDAYCGAGQPYSVFISQGKSDKLYVEFMGGGACWSASTCYGPNLRTWMYPIPELPSYSFLTSENVRNPIREHSMIYIPYCTGDVYAGNHVAKYEFGIKTRHVGHQNILKTLEHLAQKQLIAFADIKEIVLGGSSAGAIGALSHSVSFDPYIPTEARRFLIADSPGLHFGQHFWDKFTLELLTDFRSTFQGIDLEIDAADGFVAKRIDAVFRRLNHWNIGIMQATHDLVMSEVFGDISPDNHAELVLSTEGLSAVQQTDHVKTWIPHSKFHTFLLTAQTSDHIRDPNQENALEFFLRFYGVR